MQQAFHSKWRDIEKNTRSADERVLFVDTTEVPVTQRQLNLYYYFLFIQEILRKMQTKIVLEVGCGRGTMGLYVAKYLNLDVSLLDNEEDAITVAKRSFKKYGQRGRFYVGNALKTELPEQSFDAVISIGLAEHFEIVDDVFREQYRLLKPGGVMVSLNIPKKFSIQSLNTVMRILKKIVGKYKENIRKDYYRNTLKPKEYKVAAQKAGFQNVEITHVNPFPIYTPLGRDWDKKITSINKFILNLRFLFQKYPYKTNRFVAQAHFLIGHK